MGKLGKALKKIAGGEFKELGVRAREELNRRQERQHHKQKQKLFTPERYNEIFSADFRSRYLSDDGTTQFAQAIRDKDSHKFFPGFARLDQFAALKEKAPYLVESIVSAADNICENKFPIFDLGFVSYGNPPRFNYDPINDVTAPDQFYGEIDYLDAEKAGDTKVIWEVSRLQWVYDLGQAWFLTGDEKYAQKFFELLHEWNRQNPDYHGINFCSALEFAFRLHSLLWSAYFFKDSAALTEEQAADWYRFVHLCCHFIENHLSTYFSPNTHLLGEAYGLYIGGLLLPEFADSARWKKKGYEILLAELGNQITTDGMHAELSTAYHAYTLEFVLSTTIISEQCGEQIDDKFRARLADLTNMQKQLRRPDSTWPHIGDEDGGRLFFLSRLRAGDYNPILEAAELYLGESGSNAAHHLESFWLTGCDLKAGSEDLGNSTEANSVAFRDAGLIVSRSGKGKCYCLFQCGRFGYLDSPHSHADMLHLDISVGQDNFIVDPGTYFYTGDRDKRDRFRSLAMHNGPHIKGTRLLDPSDPFGWLAQPDCLIHKSVIRDQFDLYRASCTVEQRDNNYSARRDVFYDKEGLWVVLDRLAAQKATQAHWNFITPFEVSQHDNAFVLKGRESDLTIQALTDKDSAAQFQLSDCEISDDYLSTIAGTKIGIALPERKQSAMLLLIRSIPKGVPIEQTAEYIAVEKCVGCVLSSGNDERKLILFSNGGINLNDVVSDAEFLYLVLRGNRPVRLAACGVSYVDFRSETLFKSKLRCEYVDLQVQDSNYLLDVPVDTEIVIPKAATLI